MTTKKRYRIFFISFIMVSFALTACNSNNISPKTIQTDKSTINSAVNKLSGSICIGKNDLFFLFTDTQYFGHNLGYLCHNNSAYLFYYKSEKSETASIKRVEGLDGIQDIVWLEEGNYLGLFKDGSVKYWNDEYIAKNKGPYTIKNFTCSKIVGYFDQAFFLKSDGTVWYDKVLDYDYDNGGLFNASPKQVNDLKGNKIIDIASSGGGQNYYDYLSDKSEISPNSIINNYLIALTLDGKVLTWNNYLKVPKLKVLYENKDVVKIEALEGVFFAITKHGELYRWGEDNGRGIVGKMEGDRGDLPELFVSYKKPTKMNLPGKVKQIALSINFALALLEDGTVWGWEGAVYEDGWINAEVAPDEIARKLTLTGVAKVFANGNNAIAYMNDGSIKKWGVNGSYDIFGANSCQNIKTISKLEIKNNKLIKVN